jgi:hypothetical protein
MIEKTTLPQSCGDQAKGERRKASEAIRRPYVEAYSL